MFIQLLVMNWYDFNQLQVINIDPVIVPIDPNSPLCILAIQAVPLHDPRTRPEPFRRVFLHIN